MLASITSVAEAMMALDANVDIIDMKDPEQGALGALDHAVARQIVSAVGSFGSLSATVGDFPQMQAAQVFDAAVRTMRLGVSYVKVGLWSTPNDAECVRELGRLSGATRLVAVLFADRPYDPSILDACYAAGFTGVMFDTAEKRGASLRLLKTEMELALFVRRVHSLGMLCGLAGKLRLDDIAPLLTLRPDYLGFRGALCEAGARTNRLDPAALATVRDRMRDIRRQSPESGKSVDATNATE